jgi:hypothetical protein
MSGEQRTVRTSKKNFLINSVKKTNVFDSGLMKG